jgi:hypothetical protein
MSASARGGKEEEEEYEKREKRAGPDMNPSSLHLDAKALHLE